MKKPVAIALCFVALLVLALSACNAQKRPVGRSLGSVTFEYLPGKTMSGVVSTVFPDGSVLINPDEIPQEWRAKNPDQIIPSYFHVDKRAFLFRDSQLGREYSAYEQELTSLASTEWRNPPGNLLEKGCEFYYKALELDIASPQEGAILESKIVYFGHSPLWATARIRDRGFDDIVERCDKVWVISQDKNTLHFILKKASEPDESKRNILMKATKNGGGEALYTFPGDPIMFTRYPDNPNLFFASITGWPDRESGKPDPRWQSVYLFDIADPDSYKIVRYPLPPSPRSPKGDERLYGASGFFSEDGKFFYALLYGFEEEGGGLWVADISEENFYKNTHAFSQIFSWDHALSFLLLPKAENSPYHTALMTGKEVNDDFAMTLNVLNIKFDGLESELIRKERLIRMVGWNPVPFAYQWISDEEVQIYIEAYLNFESEVVPRVKGVYTAIVNVK